MRQLYQQILKLILKLVMTINTKKEMFQDEIHAKAHKCLQMKFPSGPTGTDIMSRPPYKHLSWESLDSPLL